MFYKYYSILFLLLDLSATKAFQTVRTNKEAICPSARFLSKEDMCGEGFYKQTGPDGDYCVFDYDNVKFGAQSNDDNDDEHYWEGLEKQNQARKKFGLKPLTPEQYVALQAQNHAIGAQQADQAIDAAFAQFDTNQDGVITLQELQLGLESILRMELSEASCREVMQQLDTSGDGLLQREEMVSLDNLKKAVAAQPPSKKEDKQSSGIFQSFLQNLAFHLEDTCQSNFDCERPEVCCDFGYKKMCCSSGKMAQDLQLEYELVPVPLGKVPPEQPQFQARNRLV